MRLGGCFGVDVAGGEIVHDAIPPHRPDCSGRRLRLAQVDAKAGGFEWRSAGVIKMRVVTEQAQVGHVAAGGKAIRDGPGEPDRPASRQPVEVRGDGRLQRSTAVQLRSMIVSRAVGDEDQIFHKESLESEDLDDLVEIRLDPGDFAARC